MGRQDAYSMKTEIGYGFPEEAPVRAETKPSVGRRKQGSTRCRKPRAAPEAGPSRCHCWGLWLCTSSKRGDQEESLLCSGPTRCLFLPLPWDTGTSDCTGRWRTATQRPTEPQGHRAPKQRGKTPPQGLLPDCFKGQRVTALLKRVI